ncbi:phage portal protein [Mesorhizobium sp. M1A.F.Ca.ET.072.01.1.1]|uniref:phage portal protein n=1 Tax=Mesorhizobium sp. M1A.F.Ca.ET.072.01.1.1 TaxID=2496753 RepID=UPI000FD2D2ED|nr:phage portal protein [Mesorhizobium sp. M1A.F.Ca.ET.072.01.1.1]RUW55061.1 phage portal protein [Mesorhizobium sp. M1A.F.Ca.ET.072.01.1.1]TIV04702.1 MAG: phage portal protein [Mesorhizobium sp.]
MGIWARLFGREAKKVSYSSEFDTWFASRVSKAGTTVNWDTALDVTTVLACVRAVADGIAQVPLHVMRHTAEGNGSVVAPEHPLYQVLFRKPNDWQTSFGMRETMIFHLMLTGDAFFFKILVRGKVKGLIPLEPGNVSVVRNDDYSLTYTITGANGQTMVVPQQLVWHVRGPSWNTWLGMDATKRAREAIGLAMATETTQGELHANGMQMSGVLSTDQKIDPQKYIELQKWIAAQVGGANKHKPLVIDSGLNWMQRSMTGVDAQHLETRKFQIEEICRAFKVFPQMVGHSDKTATFASAEAFFDAHIKHTLLPWCERIEASIDCDLLGDDTQEGYCAKFDLWALERGATKDRSEYFTKALGAGGTPAWMTQDEVRAKEGLNPKGGDAANLPKPTNVAPVGGDNGGKPTKDNNQ